MEYSPVNLAAPGKAGGQAFQSTLGPYDHWAIDYAYRQLPPGTNKDQEEVELMRIASRSSEPLLAYGSDEDTFLGLDPETVQWDLGADPLAFAAKRLAIAQDLFKRQETRVLPGDRDYAVLRRSLSYALGDVYRAVGVLVRHFGGVRTLRDHPGSGRDPLVPVTAEVQRAALKLISQSVLSIEGLAITPALQRRLAPDYFDRLESAGMATDFAVPQRLLDLQRAVLNYLLSDFVAARVLDSAGKLDKPSEAFRLSELYKQLSADVWSELASGAASTPSRRELQRDHATRLSVAVLRPAGGQRADARSLMRQDAQTLLARIDARLKKGTTLDAETRAHLNESAEMLRQALQARVVRGGP
jgi:Met-zincin